MPWVNFLASEFQISFQSFELAGNYFYSIFQVLNSIRLSSNQFYIINVGSSIRTLLCLLNSLSERYSLCVSWRHNMSGNRNLGFNYMLRLLMDNYSLVRMMMMHVGTYNIMGNRCALLDRILNNYWGLLLWLHLTCII